MIKITDEITGETCEASDVFAMERLLNGLFEVDDEIAKEIELLILRFRKYGCAGSVYLRIHAETI